MNKLLKLKKTIVQMVAGSKEGHLPSALSVLDIIWVLYDRVLNVTPASVNSEDRDRFILSKGHASVGLYSVLAEKGFISQKELDNYASLESSLGGHPDRNKVVGVEASTGSLGHGMPMAVGTALGLKVKKIPAKVFVLVGDGEANEGTIWESTLLAAHHKLDNLTVIVDHNHSTDRALGVENLLEKFRSFGWETVEINGHDHEAIFSAVTQKHPGKPLAVVAQTIKGFGIKSIENDPAWHHKIPTAEEANKFLSELV